MNKKKGGVLQDALSTFGTNAFGAVLALISSFCIMPVLDPGGKRPYHTESDGGQCPVYSALFQRELLDDLLRFALQAEKRGALHQAGVCGAHTCSLPPLALLVVLVLRDSYFADTAHSLLHLRCLLRCIFVCLQCFPCHFARGKQIPCL